MSRLRTLMSMDAYVRSIGEGNRGAANRLRHAPPVRVRHSYPIKMKHAVNCLFALALGFAMGLVFRGTENLGLLEWVMVLLAIAAMAAGYYIRGIELDGNEARPLSRSHGRSNVIRLASQPSPVPGSGSLRERRASVSSRVRTSHRPEVGS
jgi:hypothetical protein